jgi:starch phosphorylase
VPRFFDRNSAGCPTEWAKTMRAAMSGALWQFSTARMLTEYVDRLYLPAVRTPVEA